MHALSCHLNSFYRNPPIKRTLVHHGSCCQGLVCDSAAELTLRRGAEPLPGEAQTLRQDAAVCLQPLVPLGTFWVGRALFSVRAHSSRPEHLITSPCVGVLPRCVRVCVCVRQREDVLETECENQFLLRFHVRERVGLCCEKGEERQEGKGERSSRARLQRTLTG